MEESLSSRVNQRTKKGGSVPCLRVSSRTRRRGRPLLIAELHSCSSFQRALWHAAVDGTREGKPAVAGCEFGCGRGLDKEILHEVEDSGVLYVPGVMTPTEVLCAYEAGAKLVKVYPTTILGGSKYISTLKRSFPRIPMVASQGISTDSIKQYIDAGTSAVVLSDAIFDKNSLKQRDFETIRRLAGLAVSNVALAGT